MDGHFSFKLTDAVRNAGPEIILIRGWEKQDELEDEISSLFPGQRVRVLTAKEAIALPDAEIERVNLVAILQADALFPKGDFRADERAFQLIRRIHVTFPEKPLVIQTAKSGHPVFKALKDKPDLDTMLEERKTFNLPPFSRAVEVIVRDSSGKRLDYLSSALMDSTAKALSGNSRADGIRPLLQAQPAETPIAEKSEGEAVLRWFFPKEVSETKKKVLAETVRAFEKSRRYTGHIHIDVDPT